MKIPLFTILVTMTLALSGVGAARAAEDGVAFAAGPSGLTALSYAAVPLLGNGDFTVDEAILTGPDGFAVHGGQNPVTRAFDPTRREMRQSFEWGTVGCAYRVNGSRLELDITVRNTSDRTLTSLHLTPLTLRFPRAPDGWQSNYPYLGANRGDPTIEYANYGTGAVAVCNDDVVKPLLVGFPGRASLTERPITCTTTNIGFLSPYLDPYLKRSIAPHASDEFHLSLRFGPASAPAMALAGDLYRKLGKAFPPILHWTDRRPIGTLHLATSEPQFHSAANPRGWFSQPDRDVVTPDGIAAFHKRVLKFADDSVTELRKMKAQGMITWDIEGEEFPQTTTYIGDPRLLRELAPEMDSLADAYFKKFRDAGLRTGLCIRPQKLLHTPARTEQEELPNDAAITDILYDKMAYANKRWGCTLFYVDSNGDPNVPFDPVVFENLARRLTAHKIDALVMPEHRNTRYFSCSAPYAELRNGVTGTPEVVRAAYPDAFMNNYIPDGDYAKNKAALITTVRGGDVLMFRGWWDDPQNSQVGDVYHAAGK